MYISKRADLLDALKDAIISLWDINAGPFENIMGGMTSFIPFVPGLGWAYFFIEKFVSWKGYGMNDWGRWIDSKLGLGPGSDISPQDVPIAMEQGLRFLTPSTANSNEQDIEKVAFWGMLSKIPVVTKVIWTLIRVLVTALGVRKISEIYTHPEILNRGGGLIQTILPGQKDTQEKDSIDEIDAGKIQQFLQNPTQVLENVVPQYTNMFNSFTQRGTNMSWEKSETMREFLKLAEKTDLLKTAAPSPNPNQEDKKVIEEKRQKSPEKNIIDEAHPESVYIAEARGDGGLVENANEQQKKLIEMINKMPTGSLVGRYASAAFDLMKMADVCDEAGETEAADALTDAAAKILEMAAELPFDEAPAE